MSSGIGSADQRVTLFLSGDVMTGRGVDQILRHPVEPRLFEPFVKDARRYVELAEVVNGPIPRRVSDAYVWGDAMDELERAAPRARIINLETAVTTASDPWEKGINYRMHPRNVSCLTVAGIDCCVLANNHVLDWGHDGLRETLAVLKAAGLSIAGAGLDRDQAERPAALPLGTAGRLLVFAFGLMDSGIPPEWAAGDRGAGVHLVRHDSAQDLARLEARIRAEKRPGDLAIASIHWGGNWGYGVPSRHIDLGRRLREAGIDLVHGHSSHHPRPFGVEDGKLILYGCGDLLNDYEGIGGYEAFRGDLVLAYLPELDVATGALVSLRMVPFRLIRFRLTRASQADAEWLEETLNRVGRRFATRVRRLEDNSLGLVSG